MKSTTVSLCGSSVDLRFPDDWLADVELLFGETHAASTRRTRLTVTERPSGCYAIGDDDDRIGDNLDRSAALTQLSEVIASRLAGDVRDGVALHAGAVTRNGDAILLPGQSGAGKSSLVAWFVDRGFRYGTDELSILTANGKLAYFRRALLLKGSTDQDVAVLPNLGHMPRRRMGNHWALRPILADEPADGDNVRCRLILFPDFREGAELAIEPMSPAKACADMMASNVNAANLTDGGLGMLSTLARQTPAVRLVYGGFDQLDGVLDTLTELALGNEIDGDRLRKLLSSIQPRSPPAAKPARYEIPDATPRRKAARLTIGMATYDDYDGVYFSLQALRLYHPEIVADAEFIVVDNHPDGPCAKPLKALERDIPNYRYIPEPSRTGTSVKNRVFEEACGEFVLCIDSHVFLVPGSIKRLLAYFADNAESADILHGPLLYDNLESISTHFRPEWSGGMFGVWDTNSLAEDIDAAPFEIPMQGMGLFACRRATWPHFNRAFRGFGGEEWYIHEKFRRNGGRALCLPFLRWVHRFNRPLGVPYRNTLEDRIWNYLVGFRELQLSTDEMERHFRTLIGEPRGGEIIARLKLELEKLQF